MKKALQALAWIYARHLLTFAAGASLGAAVGMTVTAMAIVTMLIERGLM